MTLDARVCVQRREDRVPHRVVLAEHDQPLVSKIERECEGVSQMVGMPKRYYPLELRVWVLLPVSV